MSQFTRWVTLAYGLLFLIFQPEDKYRLADPICTFLFSVLVLFTTITVLRDTLHVIMEG